MFIVIEGLDGCGKSTVAQHLSKKLEAVLLTTPGSDFKDIRSHLDMIFSNNIKARQLFYMASVFKVSEEVKELKELVRHVVVDRYWLSTQVYHRWMSNDTCLDLHEVEGELLKPDLTVYLDLHFDERNKRIEARNGNTREDMQTLTQQADNELRDYYEQMRDSEPVGKWLKVDASKDIYTIVDTILGAICEV
ncbi:dTMP kinase [Aliivibrio fischeri]|uniref:dTMP kinase n=1 Tax=Aliivibrio fischeri TaxID=668 RepID=UPI0012D9E354|nr:dTMP kinase [Aliivibrio fischeri]MUH96581.1 dTMP kinase [Aliivibrio fischeri]MUI63069.1 dTMP kinase [Aliivibrio fischeri]